MALIDTYAGLHAFSNWRVGLHELCTGVNERQGLLGTTKTQFWKADGTQGADVALEDFTLLHANLADVNLDRIQGAIRTMAPQFTVALESDTVYSVATLEAAIGTTLQDDPEKTNDTRFWQAQRDALDLLLFSRTTGSPSSGYSQGSNSSRHYLDPAPVPSTPQEAWDDRFYYTFGPASTALLSVSWSMAANLAGKYQAGQASANEITWVTGVRGAGFHKAVYTVLEECDGGPLLDYALGSASATMSGSASATVELETVTNDFAGGMDVLLEITTADPTTVPFGIPSGIIDRSRITAQGVTLYWDFTGHLTDQE